MRRTVHAASLASLAIVTLAPATAARAAEAGEETAGWVEGSGFVLQWPGAAHPAARADAARHAPAQLRVLSKGAPASARAETAPKRRSRRP